MEKVLRTLKVRLVADSTEYTGVMAMAQAQALALKTQLATMFSLGSSAVAAAQLTGPLTQAARQLTSLQGQMGGAFKAIESGAASAQRQVASLAQTQARMMQDAVNSANAMRQLPGPAAPIGPAPTPQSPLLSGPSGSAAAMSAAAAAGQSRTREMFPIGDSYEAQNPIWRVRQRQLEDAAYAKGPGSKEWSDYQNARMAGGLKPAVWYDATKYLEDKSAAGGIAQQMQRMQDEGAQRAAQSAGLPRTRSAGRILSSEPFGPPAPVVLNDPASIEAERRARELEASAAKFEAERDKASNEKLAALERAKAAQARLARAPYGGRRFTERLNPDAPWWEDARYGSRTEMDQKFSPQGRRAVKDIQRAEAEAQDARARAKQLAEDAERARAQAADWRAQAMRTREEVRRREQAESARAPRPQIGSGGNGGAIPPGAGAAAAAAAGSAGLPAVITAMAKDAESVRGSFANTRELWRQMVQESGGVRQAIGNLMMGAGQGMIRRGNRMVTTGTHFSTRFSMPAAIAGGLALNQSSEFESSIAQVGVYARDAGATASQINRLSDRARELGRTTSFSATEVADAMRDMLAAGMSVEQTFDKVLPALKRMKREKISVDEFIETEGLRDGLREVRDLSEELDKAELGTFRGQLSQLGGALDDLSISIGKAGLLEFASDVAKGMANLVDGLAKADPALLSVATAGAGLLAVIGPSIVAAGSLLWGVGQLAQGLGGLVTIMTGPVGLTVAAAALGGALVVGLMGAFTNLTQGGNELAQVLGRLNELQGNSASLSEEYKTASEERAIQIRRERNAIFELMQIELARAEKLAKQQAADPFKYASGPVMFRSMTALGQAQAATERVAQERAELEALAKSWDDAHKARAEYLKLPVEPDPIDKRDPLSPEDQAAYEQMMGKSSQWGGAWATTSEEVQTSAQVMAERLNYWLGKGIDPGVAANIAAAEAVSQAWFKTYDDVVGHSYVPDMVDQIGWHMNRLEDVAVAPAAKATDKIAKLFEDLGTSVGTAMDDIGSAIGGGLKGALNGLPFGNAPNSAELMRSISGNLQRQTWGGVVDSGFSMLGDTFKGWSGATKGEKGWTDKKDGSWLDSALSWIGDLFGGGRANGGSVFPGRIYEVGEFGREKFIPKVPGYIANDNQWNAMTRGGGGGGGVTNVFNFPNTDPQRFMASRGQVEASMARTAYRARRMG